MGTSKRPVASLRTLLRETALGYATWSLIQALPPMVWFYPLNELEISGYEAFAVVFFSPIFFVGPLRHLVQNRWILAVLRLVSVFCIGSFQAPSTLSRLVNLSIGNFTNMLVFVATLWSSSSYQRFVTFWGQLLGLVAIAASRVWFVSFHPAWWNNTTNSCVMAVVAIAVLDKIISGEDGYEDKYDESAKSAVPWPIMGISYGCLIYIVYALFGEVSILSRWVVTGYPDPGPEPFYSGIAVLVCLGVGILLCDKGFVKTTIWWLIGSASLLALLYLHGMAGLLGGLVFAIYIMSIWPLMTDHITRCPPASTLTLAMITLVCCTLFNVWTVAYNFVPGGEYTREHTDWLVAFIIVFLGLATLIGSSPKRSRTSLTDADEYKMNTSISLVLLLIVTAGLGGFAVRFNPDRYNNPAKVHPKADFSAAIWTYHFGYDNQGWPSLERTAQLLNNTGADVITLLESDASKPFLGNNDLGMWLGERLGMYVDFGPSTRDHTWGNLILSKYPIVQSTHHLLPSPKGELAPAVTATVNMTGHLVDFVVTHMGNDRDVVDRKLQADYLAKELKNAANPVVFMGYVTSKPKSRDYNTLIKQGNMKDIDDTDTDRFCEYIMYRGLQRLGYARISHGGLSDTEVQMARFRIPVNPKQFTDNNKITTTRSKADKDVIKYFNEEKFGSHYSGHYYPTEHHFHMNTPKYFL